MYLSFVIPKIPGLNGVQNYKIKKYLRCKNVTNRCENVKCRCKIDNKSGKIVKNTLFYDFPYTFLAFS